MVYVWGEPQISAHMLFIGCYLKEYVKCKKRINTIFYAK